MHNETQSLAVKPRLAYPMAMGCPFSKTAAPKLMLETSHCSVTLSLTSKYFKTGVLVIASLMAVRALSRFLDQHHCTFCLVSCLRGLHILARFGKNLGR